MKPPKKTNLDRAFWKRDAEIKQLVAERIAYLEQKLKAATPEGKKL